MNSNREWVEEIAHMALSEVGLMLQTRRDRLALIERPEIRASLVLDGVDVQALHLECRMAVEEAEWIVTFCERLAAPYLNAVEG